MYKLICALIGAEVIKMSKDANKKLCLFICLIIPCPIVVYKGSQVIDNESQLLFNFNLLSEFLAAYTFADIWNTVTYAYPPYQSFSLGYKPLGYLFLFLTDLHLK